MSNKVADCRQSGGGQVREQSARSKMSAECTVAFGNKVAMNDARVIRRLVPPLSPQIKNLRGPQYTANGQRGNWNARLQIGAMEEYLLAEIAASTRQVAGDKNTQYDWGLRDKEIYTKCTILTRGEAASTKPKGENRTSGGKEQKSYPISKQLYPIFRAESQCVIRWGNDSCKVLYPIMRATFGEKAI